MPENCGECPPSTLSDELREVLWGLQGIAQLYDNSIDFINWDMDETDTQKGTYSVQSFIDDLRASRCREVLFMLYERNNGKKVGCEDVVCFGIANPKYLYDDNYNWPLEFCINGVDKNSPLVSVIFLGEQKNIAKM